MKVLILGTTGYTGSLLLSLLHRHPEVRDIIPVSHSHAGKAVRQLFPQLATSISEKLSLTKGKTLSIEAALESQPDLVFSCLPHGHSAGACLPFRPAVIIDLSADFRLINSNIYKKIYKVNAPSLGDAHVAYGLSECFQKQIRHADIIANPGCYPTSALIPLLPLLQHRLISEAITIHAMSGISGAGKKPELSLLFCEKNESLAAYKPGSTHRHHAEIKEKLELAGPLASLQFIPHLVPLSSGLYSTITTRTARSRAEILSCLRTAYEGKPFIRIHEQAIPDLHWVQSTNHLDIGLHLEKDRLILFSAIDNLWKGASGQAVQNMNIRFGFPEHLGLQ